MPAIVETPYIPIRRLASSEKTFPALYLELGRQRHLVVACLGSHGELRGSSET